MDERFRQAVAESAEKHGAHLIDLVVRGTSGRAVVEIFVDNEEGVTADLCAGVSRDLVSAIESLGLLTGSYRLDVSSPGIDRPIRYRWQYGKHVGRPMKIRRAGEQGVNEVVGTLLAVGEEYVELRVKETTEAVRVPFGEIEEARVQLPW